MTETAAVRGTHLVVIHGSNLLAEYETCGCPSHPQGGLARRATVADRARAEADGVLVVDSGDALLPRVSHEEELVPPSPAEIERRATLILGAYARMGIAAFLPGERDLAIGLPRLKRLLSRWHVPAVAANLVTTEGEPIFPRDRLVSFAGVRVGIFGVIGPPAGDQGLVQGATARAIDPIAAARDEIASLRGRGAQIVVALVHLESAEAVRALLTAAPGIDFAVQGHPGQQLETVDTVGAAHRMEAFTLGKVAGRLDVHVVDADFTFVDRGDRAEVETRLLDHRRQLVDLARRAAEDTGHALAGYFRSRRDGLEAAVAREERQLAALPTAIAGSWFEHRLIPLDEAIPDQTGVGLLVASYDATSVKRAAHGLPVGVSWRARPPAPGTVPGLGLGPGAEGVEPPATSAAGTADRFAGSAACAGCHVAAWEHYRTTKHARAFAALVAVNRQRDPACVGCHVTGYLQPGGPATVSAATTPSLRNVGCESCHGAGRAHIAASAAQRTQDSLPSRMDDAVCLGCHTADQTRGEWDGPAFRAAILGPGHGKPPAPRAVGGLGPRAAGASDLERRAVGTGVPTERPRLDDDPAGPVHPLL